MQYTTTPGVQGICPTGWHIPTDAEWCALANTVDAGTISCSSQFWQGIDAGGNLKEAGTAHWASPNIGATNSSGFTALPGGNSYHIDGSFSDLGYSVLFWNSSEYDGIDAWRYTIAGSSAQISRNHNMKLFGMSVRCLRD